MTGGVGSLDLARALAAPAVCLLVLLSGGDVRRVATAPGRDLLSASREAAAAAGVRADVLLAMAHTESRGHPPASARGAGGWIRLHPARPSRSPRRGSALSGVALEEVLADDAAALSASAALLADAARATGIDAATAPARAWGPALVRFHGGRDALANRLYADDVLGFLARGFVGRDQHGVRYALGPAGSPPGPARWPARPGDVSGASFAPFLPASESGQHPMDIPIRRPRFIVIHTTEGSFPTILEYFQGKRTEVAAHYLLRASDGLTVQMVDERRVAFHDACFNEASIGIEHEAHAGAGGAWFGEALYRASARLVRDVALRHGIPLDRDHILGHDEAPDCSTHTDPGPAWDWARFMELVRSPAAAEQVALRAPVDGDRQDGASGVRR